MDNCNKEKVTNTDKITRTTGINETTKMPLLKLFLYFTIRGKCLLIKWIYIYIYIYIIQGDIFFKSVINALKSLKKCLLELLI